MTNGLSIMNGKNRAQRSQLSRGFNAMTTQVWKLGSTPVIDRKTMKDADDSLMRKILAMFRRRSK